MPRQECFDFDFDFDFTDAAPADPPPCDPNVERSDVRRLAGQNAAILELLREKREVPNYELNKISMKYTGRLSDLRKAGYNVQISRRDGAVHWYSLIEEKQE